MDLQDFNSEALYFDEPMAEEVSHLIETAAEAYATGGAEAPLLEAFRLAPDAAQKGARPIAWYASATPLRSGWAWGQQYLNGAAGGVEGDLGKGKVYLFGPEIAFRGQPHGTFKFLFNAISLAGAKSTSLP